jgi:uncharacterized protein (DUF885 family)
MLTRRALLESAAATTVALATPALADTAPASQDAALNQMFGSLCDEVLVESPEGATALGLDKGAHADLRAKLSDESWAAVEASHKMCADWIAKLGAVPSAQLSQANALNKDVVLYALTLGKDGGAFAYGNNTLANAMGESAGPYVVCQESGNFIGIPEFLDSQHRIETKADADAYLARLEAFAVTLDQETERVKHDVGIGVCPPDFLLKTATGQMTRYLTIPAAQSRIVSSLATRASAKGLAGDYGAKATRIAADKVYPAITRQLAALNTAAKTATHDAGVWKIKDGEAYYAWLLRVGTTTDQTAAAIHQTGLQQNDEITARMDTLLRKQGLTKGTVGARMTALASDPRFVYPDTDAGRAQVLDYLNKLIAQVRTVMPKASRLSLKAPVVVKRVPPDIQDGAGLGYMNPGSMDGTRPSIYYINLKTTSNWPKFSLPTLTHHETIPGHAWQGAYLNETGKLPLIRILLSGFNAYVEGWALYAEQLSDELGLYDDDPFGQLDYLQAQQFRAVRLVVDTGIHAMRWTRERAVQWAVEQTGRTDAAMTSEIDRYCGTPGQACGYKVGHNELLRLRDKTKAELGPRYDLRDYDDWVVEAGAVPLTVLDTVIDRRIAEALKG